jgi:ubiquinone/menaquinone biosynthesis C-methylase UbiE
MILKNAIAFTAGVYAQLQNQEIFLCDYSIEMLKIGKSRLEKAGAPNSSVHFLRADALNMPLKNDVLQTVFCFGILHIFDDSSRLIEECKRILKDGGKLYITSLCTDRKFSARYLKFLHNKGHVARPMSSEEIIHLIENGDLIIEKSFVKGGMTYITVRK